MIAVHSAIEDVRTASNAASVLAIIGVVNLPIIHYSVVWWNSLHQPNMKLISATPSVHPSMLVPLVIMAVAFKTYFIWLLFIRIRNEILSRERSASWVRKMIEVN